MYGEEPEFCDFPAMVTGSTVPEKVPMYPSGVDSFDGIYDFEGIEGFVYSDVDLMPRGGGGDQLTVSYCGEVYVFDNVTTEKMQKVFLHLGGCDLPTGQQGAESYQNHKDFDYPGRCSDPRRAASLNRFREKRKERCFEKKIRYDVRQKVASRLNRKKGKFVLSPTPISSALPNVVEPDHALPDETTLELSDNISSLYDHFEI